VADAVAIIIVFATAALLPTDQRDFGLAFGYLISYTAGLAMLAVLLHRRLGRLDGRRIVCTHVRPVIAGIFAGVLGLCIERWVRSEVPSGWPGAFATVMAASIVGGGAFVFLASHMRITELRRLLTTRPRS
jgi:putative peptidoglycan lipid II flippase